MHALVELNLWSLGRLSSQLQKLVEARLWLQVVLGLVFGLLVGALIGPDLEIVGSGTSLLIASWLALPGQLFLALIQMIVVPLVLASVVRGLTAASSMTQLKQLGLYGGLFFLLFTVLSSIVGLSLAEYVDPGRFVDDQLIQQSVDSTYAAPDRDTQLPALQDIPQRFVRHLNKLGVLSLGHKI